MHPNMSDTIKGVRIITTSRLMFVCELEGGGVFDRPPTPTGQAASLAVLPALCETAVCGSKYSFFPLRKGTPAAKILQTAARILIRALFRPSEQAASHPKTSTPTLISDMHLGILLRR